MYSGMTWISSTGRHTKSKEFFPASGVRRTCRSNPLWVSQTAVHLKPERLVRFGLQSVEVLDAIRTAFQGAVVGQVYQGSKIFDVSVILAPEDRRTPEAVGALPLAVRNGGTVLVKEIADVFGDTGRFMIAHDGARRRQVVTCNVRGRDTASFVAEAKQRVRDQVRFPAGSYYSFAGAAETRSKAVNEVLLHSLVVGVGIVLLLGIAFGNVRNLMLVLINLPFALVGGIWAVFFSGGLLSVGSLVGFVTLFGISTRNSIMLISHFEHLVEKEGRTWNLETALEGALGRLLPILMTALVTGFGLLPIAIGSGEAGREIEGPMAIVILGGLLTSTALNLLVLPSLSLRFGRFVSDSSRFD